MAEELLDDLKSYARLTQDPVLSEKLTAFITVYEEQSQKAKRYDALKENRDAWPEHIRNAINALEEQYSTDEQPIDLVSMNHHEKWVDRANYFQQAYEEQGKVLERLTQFEMQAVLQPIIKSQLERFGVTINSATAYGVAGAVLKVLKARAHLTPETSNER